MMENVKAAMSEIIIIGNARCYHSMDWYRTIKKVCSHREILFATDLIDSESHQKITCEDDHIIDLYNIDWLLFKRQTNMGNVWRNIVKFLVSPLQILKIRSIEKKYPNAVFHAHTMYYMFCCWLARIKFVGTPQGSEVLVRPDRSSIYKYFACKALKAADHLIVDSTNLKNRIRELCGKDAVVIQNGMDASTILMKSNKKNERTKVTSFRGMYPIYRIDEIVEGRTNSRLKPPLTFSYPFWEEEYKGKIISKLERGDTDLGRLPLKDEVYELLFTTVLAISIPKSDSSPRSVYEAIFCGCCVAVTYNPWIESLPSCMRSRLFIVDLQDKAWFDKAIEFAHSITKNPFVPSQTALDLFDQERTMKKVAETFYEV
ncbi:MAG: glycosyltransferase family 4 protein [Candidatus Manganitrophus sp. SB1]|nr:glycosyltransferase family 4 protein [Candidatus Manganitrophus morganii]